MTYPVQIVSKTQVVKDWLIAMGWNVTQESGFPLYSGPEILSSPDRAVFITPTSGPGYITEEAGLDCWGFQCVLRGPADDPDTPEGAVQQLDNLILFSTLPVNIDGVDIIAATRSGGTPVPLPLSPDDRRFSYVATYLVTTGVSLWPVWSRPLSSPTT